MNLRISDFLLHSLRQPPPHEPRPTPLPQPTVEIDRQTDRETPAAIAQLAADGAMMKSRVLRALPSTAPARFTPQQMPTKADWQRRALENAGINPANWKPEKGFAYNKENVQKVYAQYERLYVDHPELLWAGMAKMAGGVVYGGLQQIDANERRASIGGVAALGINPAAGIGALYAARELEFVERKLLTMQQEIYLDLGWQHMAYAEGGLRALEACYERGEIKVENLNAWRKIASGDENRIWEGNTELLYREQNRILGPHYEELSKRPVTGTGLRHLMSMLAESPMPTGRPMRGINGTVTNGNILEFEDRWQWIQTETVARFRSYSPEYRRTLVSQPLQELVERRFARNPAEPQPQPHPTPGPAPRPR